MRRLECRGRSVLPSPLTATQTPAMRRLDAACGGVVRFGRLLQLSAPINHVLPPSPVVLPLPMRERQRRRRRGGMAAAAAAVPAADVSTADVSTAVASAAVAGTVGSCRGWVARVAACRLP